MISAGDFVVFLAATGIIVAYFLVLRRVLGRAEAKTPSTTARSVATSEH